MDFIIENWYIILGLVAVVVTLGYGVAKFLGLPTKAQLENIKKWLLQAVIEAEIEFGSETGQLKLSYVYDRFIERFPSTSKFVSFTTFSKLVDNALDTMREMLESNQSVIKIVEGGVIW